MGRTRTIVADGTSAVTQFVTMLLCQRDLLERAAERDAEALRILTAPGLIEAANRVARQCMANKCGHAIRRIWTRRDEKRLGWIRGWTFGWPPGPCRVGRLLERFGDSHLDAYRLALGEVRRDGTAAAVSPKLAVAKDSHDRLLAHARELTQWESTPLPVLASESWEESHAVSVSQLMDDAPLPKAPPPPDPDGPVDGFRWRHNGVVIPDTMQNAAWRMLRHLWTTIDRAASFDDLIAPTYNDAEHIADASAFGSLRRASNKYFTDHSIPLRVTIQASTVSLLPAE